MFKFLDLFKKKSVPIPVIKATTQHKIDDKKQHELFLIELDALLPKLFKTEYVKNYKALYKSYKAFTGKDNTLLSKQPYFIESLRDDVQQIKKNEVKKYSKNIILLSSCRAYTMVMLDRLKVDNLVKEVTLIFPKNDLICETVIAQKKIYNNKTMPISKVPIYPLKSCIKCSSCYLGIMYKPYTKL